MKEKIKSYLDAYKKKVTTAGDELRNRPMPELTEELFSLFENTGNRLKYEEGYFLRRKYVAIFGLLSIMDHNREDIKKLEEILEDICSEECWALPAHVNRMKDVSWRNTVDLFASETAQTLSEIITVLENDLTPKVKELVRENVYSRVLNPFYNSEISYNNWEHSVHNWSAVCAGSIGSASIYLMKEDPERLEQCLNRICDSLTYYISGFSEEGGCMEGLGYFTYGMTYYVGFAVQMYEYSDGVIDLLKQEKCSRIAAFQQKCYFAGGRTIAFSDGDSRDHFKMGLTSYLAMRYPQVIIPNMEQVAEFDTDPCFRWMGIYRDYIWTNEYLKKLENGEIEDTARNCMENQVVLTNAQWSICQSRNGSGMAAKGGHNDEPHNHNDIGSFFYINGSDLLLADLGAGEYTKSYFSETRYDILCNSSLGHSVPIINGKAQLAGKEHACDVFETDGNGRTIISFAKAYEDKTIESVVRTLSFNELNGELQIEDYFEASEKTSSITENLVTECKPEILENKITLRGAQNACRITIESQGVKINYIKKAHSDHSGQVIDIYLIQWELPIHGKNIDCRIKIEQIKA